MTLFRKLKGKNTWEKEFANHVSNEKLVLRIHKELSEHRNNEYNTVLTLKLIHKCL